MKKKKKYIKWSAQSEGQNVEMATLSFLFTYTLHSRLSYRDQGLVETRRD